MSIIKDDDGNIIGCSHCGSRSLRKDGFNYSRGAKKQSWYCNSCYRKTINPKIIKKSPFSTENKEPEFLAIDELINIRTKQYRQKSKAKASRKLINVKIEIDGPIGICHFGDPHIDDDGTDITEIYSLCNLINSTEGLFGGNLGDIQNNWIGRLSFLYGQQSTSAKESWRLTEHFINQVDWLYLVAGNHDVWSGEGDPLEFIMRDHPGVYEQWGARMNLIFPNGKEIRINARHFFKGFSMWNTAHGVARAVQMGWRDHILTCGHIHISGYQVLKDPASGLISHALQVASFKIWDNFAEKKGLEDRNIFNAPVTIIDPQYDDDDNRLITTILNPYEGAEFLTYKRKKALN
jgi:hypothetical protein